MITNICSFIGEHLWGWKNEQNIKKWVSSCIGQNYFLYQSSIFSQQIMFLANISWLKTNFLWPIFFCSTVLFCSNNFAAEQFIIKVIRHSIKWKPNNSLILHWQNIERCLLFFITFSPAKFKVWSFQDWWNASLWTLFRDQFFYEKVIIFFKVELQTKST